MSAGRKRIGGIVAVAVLTLCVVAWFDGGEQPLHPIEQAIEVPEEVR